MRIFDMASCLFFVSVGLACDDDGGSGGQQAGPGGTAGGDQCASLSEAECLSASSCTRSMAYETGDLSDAGEFAGCYYSGDDAVLCGAALTCATSPTDSCKVFRNTCIPEDWEALTSCSSAGCPDLNNGVGGNGGATP